MFSSLFHSYDGYANKNFTISFGNGLYKYLNPDNIYNDSESEG